VQSAYYDFFEDSKSPAVRSLQRVIAEIAPIDVPVLLVGDSGTGKDVTARRIHELSRYRHGPFTKLTCHTLSELVLEKVWAHLTRNGDKSDSFEGGTLFLDEIAELNPVCQTKLLQKLDSERPTGRHGLGVRLISAVRRDLEDEVHARRFNRELYYRLNGICLRLPALRNRKEDVAELADFLLAKYALQLGRTKPVLTSERLRLLTEHSWPGNIRELEKVVEQIVSSGDDQLTWFSFDALVDPTSHTSVLPANLSLKEAAREASRCAERELILRSLERTHWNRKRAAKELQISYKALLYKLKRIVSDASTNADGSLGERE